MGLWRKLLGGGFSALSTGLEPALSASSCSTASASRDSPSPDPGNFDRYTNDQDASPEFVVILGPDGTIRELNQSYPGLPIENVIGTNFRNWIPDAWLADAEAAFEEAALHRQPGRVRFVADLGDGRRVNHEARVFPLEQNGELIGVAGITTDLSRAEQAEQRLRENQRRLQTLLANLPGIVYRCADDRDRTAEFMSDWVEQLTGYPPEALIGNRDVSWNGLIHPDDRDYVADVVGAALDRKESFQLEYRITTASGETKWVREQGQGILDSDGNVVALEGFIYDLTHRVTAYGRLRESQERFRDLVQAIHEIFWLTSPDGREVLYVSPSIEELTGLRPADLLDNPASFLDVVHREDHQLLLGARTASHEGRAIQFDYRIIRDGQVRWMRHRSFPVRDTEGKVLRVAGITEDITERKRADLALRASELKYRRLFENAAEPVILYDGVKAVDCNQAAAELFGFDRPEELIGRTPEEFSPPLQPDGRRSAEVIAEVAGRAWQEGTAETEHVFLDRHGKALLTKFKLALVELDGRPMIQSIIWDLTDQRRWEKLLGGIAQAGNTLLTKPSLEAALDEALAILARSMDVHRVYILERHSGDDQGSQFYSYEREWHAEWLSSSLEEPELAHLSADELDAHPLQELLNRGSPGQVMRESASAPMRALMARRQIHSLLLVPIPTGEGEHWGILGFDDCRSARSWNETEEQVLQAMAASIGGAIARQRAQQTQREEEQRIRSEQDALLRLAKHNWADDVDNPSATWREVTEAAAETLGCEGAELWLLSADRTRLSCQWAYAAGVGAYAPGRESITAKTHRAYFTILEHERIIRIPNTDDTRHWLEIPDAGMLPRTCAVMDAPVRLRGQTVGVICLRSTSSRNWSSDEETFLASVADTLSLAFEQWERVRGERLLGGVAQATQRLLALSSWRDAVSEAIAALGNAAGVDRVCVCERQATAANESAYVPRFEWSRIEGGISCTASAPALFTLVDLAGSEVHARLAAGDATIALTRDLPEPLASRWQERGVQSAVLVPIRVSGAEWGVLVLEEHRRERVPTETERALFEAIAANIGVATERNLTLQRAREEERRVREQHAALLDLARHNWFSADVGEVFREMTERAVQTLGVDSAGVWLFEPNREKLLCADAFHRETGKHMQGQEISESRAGAYIDAMESDRVIVVPDVALDPRTAMFTRAENPGVGSLLDAPMRIGGRTIGVFSHETWGERPRQWTLDEQNFAASMADLAGLALEQAERRRAESLLHGVARATDRLLTERSFEDAIEEVLAILGDVTEADRVYIFEATPPDAEDPVFELRQEWCRAGIPSQVVSPAHERSRASELGISSWLTAFRRGVVISALTRELPGSMRRFFEAQNVRSVLMVPIPLEDAYWGFIGFDDCRREHRWTMSEQSILVAMAASIGGAMSRQQIEELSRRQRTAMEAAVDGMALLAGDRYVYVNPANARLYGFDSPEEMIGRSWSELYGADERRRFETLIFPTVAETGNWKGEARGRRTDGTEFPQEVSLTRLDGDGMVCVVRDVTDRKRAESERLELERKLLETQKLESLGVLAGGIAHDFNNLLMAILGNAGLAKMEMAGDGPARETVERIELAARRAGELTRQLLAYSGKSRLVVGPVDLNHLILEMTHLLRASAPRSVEIEYDLEDNLPLVEGDATQLRQVIMNLIVNGAEAIGENPGIVRLKTSLREVDHGALKSTYLEPDLPSGKYAVIEVTDTGEGMDIDTQRKVFEPFFTTKFTGRGLGLAAVLGIVRAHSGAVTLESVPGHGTAFTLLFPIAAEAIQPVPSSVRTAPTTPDWAAGTTVLVIDDEEAPREVTAAILRHFATTAMVATSGAEGLALFREHAGSIDCVLLDLTMPQMSGVDVLRELQRIGADVPIILMSGYSEEEAVTRFADRRIAGFIQKPFSPDELAATLMRVLKPGSEAGGKKHASG